MNKIKSGFTIVELLIVIVVIVILAAISVAAYTGIQQRAKASAIGSDLTSLERAFRLLAAEHGWSTWPIDNSTELTGSGNPSIASIITATKLKDYYQSVSSATIGASTRFYYDNDGDIYGGCAAANSGGVNFYLDTVDQAIAQAVDNAIDDGNLSCGRVTWTGNLRYNMSKTQGL